MRNGTGNNSGMNISKTRSEPLVDQPVDGRIRVKVSMTEAPKGKYGASIRWLSHRRRCRYERVARAAASRAVVVSVFGPPFPSLMLRRRR
jgi:hypothetical protein